MVIDASALVAVLLGEPEAEAMLRAIAGDPRRLVGAVSMLEAAMVMDSRLGPAGARELDLLIHGGAMQIVAMTAEQVELARECYSRFGKGRHPARLNLGDCCSYALSLHSGEPLLFKGGDFVQTDVKVAKYAP